MFSGFARLWRFTKLVCFLVIFFILAQTKLGYAKDVRVGVIDVQAAVSGTKEWKREFTSFKTKFQKEKTAISAKEKQLKKMIEDLNKKSMVLSPELKKKKEDVLLKKKKDFERYVQDKNEEFAKKEKIITSKILQKMVKIITNLGKAKKFTMILEKKGGIYFDPSVDLTALAIQTYDKTK
jgi:outer membrane protein